MGSGWFSQNRPHTYYYEEFHLQRLKHTNVYRKIIDRLHGSVFWQTFCDNVCSAMLKQSTWIIIRDQGFGVLFFRKIRVDSIRCYYSAVDCRLHNNWVFFGYLIKSTTSQLAPNYVMSSDEASQHACLLPRLSPSFISLETWLHKVKFKHQKFYFLDTQN